MADFQNIVGKALSDEAFCKELTSNPTKALKDNGVTPTPEMIDALKGLDTKAIQKLAQAFGKGPAGA